MTSAKERKTASALSTNKRLWFDVRSWCYILPTIYVASIIYHVIPFLGIFNEIKEYNTDGCVRFEGPSEFGYCEDLVLLDGGVAYASCDPTRCKYNPVMGFGNLEAGEVLPPGSIWKINYNKTPKSVERFELSNTTFDFHPAGVAIDIHPVSAKITLLAANKAHFGAPSIEIFDVNDERATLTSKRTIRHAEIYSPNAVHAIQDARFRGEDGTPSFFFSNDYYFTNSALKMFETYVMGFGNVKFYNARTGQVEDGVRGLSFANGVAGTDEVLFVAETSKRSVKQYKIVITENNGIPHIQLDHINEAKFNMAVDNVRYLPKQELLFVAGHPKMLEAMKYIAAGNYDIPVRPPSQVDVWDLKTGETKVLLQDSGSLLGTATTGAFDVENSKLIVSGVYDDAILICDV